MEAAASSSGRLLGSCTNADPLKGVKYYHKFTKDEWQQARADGKKFAQYSPKGVANKRLVSDDGFYYYTTDINTSVNTANFAGCTGGSTAYLAERIRNTLAAGDTVSYYTWQGDQWQGVDHALGAFDTWEAAKNSIRYLDAKKKYDADSLSIAVVVD